MRTPILSLLLAVPSSTLFSQGVEAIPDGLDCDNLAAEFADYAEYCEDVQAVRRKAEAMQAASVDQDLDVVERIAALKDAGWEQVKAKNYEAALGYFEQARELNHELNTGWLSHAYLKWQLEDIIEAVRKREVRIASEDEAKPNREFDYWQGQGLVDAKREKAKAEVEAELEAARQAAAIDCEAVAEALNKKSTDLELIECWIDVWETTLANSPYSDPDANHEIYYRHCSASSGGFMTKRHLRNNIAKFSTAAAVMREEIRQLQAQLAEGRCD